MRKLEYIYITLLIFSALLSSCVGDDPDDGKPIVGLAQCSVNESDWRITMNKRFKANVLQRGTFVLQVTDGEGRVENQISDIKDSLIPMGIKVLMVSPKVAEALTDVISNVYKSGMPVILIDRKTTDTNYTCFISASNFQIGCKAADYAASHGKDGATILEIHGEEGASPTIDRSLGFNTRLRESYAYKNFRHVGDLHCEFSGPMALESMYDYLKNNPLPDIIWAHNDKMAIGASEAITESGYNIDDVIIIGCDGTANCGIKAVKDGLIDVTFRYPDGAEEAIRIAEMILNGDIANVPKNIVLSTYQIDKTNAEGQYQTMKTEEITQDMLITTALANKNLNRTISGHLRIMIMAFIGIIGLVMGLIYIGKLHMEKEKANEQLNEKNAEVNAQKEELEAQAQHLNEVNRQLESSKNLILGSIQTAKTIQTATLPTLKDMNKTFHTFVEYHPKDIVSGDFYWHHSEHLEDRDILITGVIDCTGHGVPGAFMSLIGINLLDQIVKQGKTFSPAQILTKLNIAVRKALRQEDPNSDNDDGMEGIICKIERTINGNIEMCYEGAKFPIYHYIKSENRIETCKSSRRPIGGKPRNVEKVQEFTDHQVEISHGDRLYLTSDGLCDQCNQARSKYGSAHLMGKLMDSIAMSMKEQGQFVWKDLATFMLGSTQRDDITLIGIEV